MFVYLLNFHSHSMWIRERVFYLFITFKTYSLILMNKKKYEKEKENENRTSNIEFILLLYGKVFFFSCLLAHSREWASATLFFHHLILLFVTISKQKCLFAFLTSLSFSKSLNYVQCVFDVSAMLCVKLFNEFYLLFSLIFEGLTVMGRDTQSTLKQ